MRHRPLGLALGILALAGCATASAPTRDPFTPVAGDPGVHAYVTGLVARIGQATEHPGRPYSVRLADLRKHGAAGVSLGGGVIYVHVGLAAAAYKFANENPGKMQVLLPMVLAHEIAHDQAGHAANQQNIQTGASAVNTVGRVMSYVPGPVGWAGAALAWGAAATSYASAYLYGREQELEADRKAIGYWTKLGLPCAVWVNRFQALADKGIQGDFRHPTEGRLAQARELCGIPAPPAPPREESNFGAREN